MKVSSICQAIDEQAAERKRRLGMPRDVLPQLPSVRNFATVVTGVRRSGKSTLLDQWTSENGGNVVSVHFDDLRLASFSADDFLLWTKCRTSWDGRSLSSVAWTGSCA